MLNYALLPLIYPVKSKQGREATPIDATEAAVKHRNSASLFERYTSVKI